MSQTQTLVLKLLETYSSSHSAQLHTLFSGSPDISNSQSFTKEATKAIRRALKNILTLKQDDVDTLKKMLEDLFQGVDSRHITLTSVLALIEDIFDCMSLESLRSIFTQVEVQLNRLEKIEQTDQNTILSFTNAMLKRISKSQDIDFRGRLLILLSRILRLCHDSGLNSKMIPNNISPIIDNEADYQGQEPRVLGVSYKFYRRFWQLQKYFNDPTHLFLEKSDEEDLLQDQLNPQVPQRISLSRLRAIENVLSETLRIFANNPVSQSPHFSKQPIKYLTRLSLIQTQLSDAYFRKLLLTQSLLFCYYLRNPSSKYPIALKEEEKSIINQIQKQSRQAMALECSNLREDDLSSKIDGVLLSQKTWIELKEDRKEKKKVLFRSPSVQLQQSILSYYKNKNDPSVPRSIFGELLNGTSKTLYDKKLKSNTEMTDRMKISGQDFIQFLKDRTIPPAEGEYINTAFDYYYQQARNALQELEDNGSITQTFGTKQEYNLYEWKAMKILYKDNLKDVLLDRKDKPQKEGEAAKIRDYRMLNIIKKREDEYKQHQPNKKQKLQ